jgi:predicted amino acid-binding ACT domain protein
MTLAIRKIQAWCGEIPDRPGAAVAKLEDLARAGADLEFLFTRPDRSKAHTSVLFIAPITSPEQVKTARAAGLAPAVDVAMLCVEGDNRPGIGYDIMSRLAVAGINLRGISISAISGRFTAYLAFDSPDVATLALQILATLPSTG